MGAGTWAGTFREGILYYDARVRGENGVFEGVAGIYPRTLMNSYFSEAFFSDLNHFTDRNFEGVLSCRWVGRWIITITPARNWLRVWWTTACWSPG